MMDPVQRQDYLLVLKAEDEGLSTKQLTEELPQAVTEELPEEPENFDDEQLIQATIPNNKIPPIDEEIDSNKIKQLESDKQDNVIEELIDEEKDPEATNIELSELQFDALSGKINEESAQETLSDRSSSKESSSTSDDDNDEKSNDSEEFTNKKQQQDEAKYEHNPYAERNQQIWIPITQVQHYLFANQPFSSDIEDTRIKFTKKQFATLFAHNIPMQYEEKKTINIAIGKLKSLLRQYVVYNNQTRRFESKKPHVKNLEQFFDKVSEKESESFQKYQQQEELKISEFSGGHYDNNGALVVLATNNKIQDRPFDMKQFLRINSKTGGERRGFLANMDIIQTNLRMGSESLSSFRISSRMVSNGVVKGGKVISPKGEKIVETIIANQGIHMVYSQFVPGGLSLIRDILLSKGFKNYEHIVAKKNTYLESKKGKYFCILTGATKQEFRDKLLQIINNPDNKYGDHIRVIMFSAAITEGINFRNTRYIHLMEPYWNYSRLTQAIARGVRNKSHWELPPEERNIQTYIYLSILGEKTRSVDQHLYEVSMRKEKLITKIVNELRHVSINCMHQPNNQHCVICEQNNQFLYNKFDSTFLPRNNPCKQLQKTIVKDNEQEILYNGVKYIIVNQKPLPGEFDFGKCVYYYDEQLDYYVRITGDLMVKILQQLKLQKKK